MQPRRFTVSVEPRGNFWQARIYIEGENGRSRRFSTGVAIGDDRRVTRREATRVAEERGRDLARDAALSATSDENSLDAVAERMLRQKTADGRRPRAIDSLAWCLEHFVKPRLGADRDVRTIRRRDLEDMKTELRASGRAPTTVNNALVAIRQVLRHACEVEELIEHVPLVRNVPVPKGSTAAKPITPSQAATFFDSFDDEEAREFNAFLLNTGLRKTETLAIRWDWIDWSARVLNIPAIVRKGGKPQRAPTPLNTSAMLLLADRRRREHQPSKGRVWFQLKGGRKGSRDYDRARRAAAETAGIAGYRHHDARHTRATQLAANGATAIDLRDQMGWSTLAMVNRYTHPERDRLHEVAGRVEFSTPSRDGSRDGRSGSSGAGSGEDGNDASVHDSKKRKGLKSL